MPVKGYFIHFKMLLNAIDNRSVTYNWDNFEVEMIVTALQLTNNKAHLCPPPPKKNETKKKKPMLIKSR